MTDTSRVPISTAARSSSALPFAVVGSACVVAGGLVAAFTAAVPSEHGAWVAAYLVLVAGVAQLSLGVGQTLLAPRAPSRRWVAAELVAWNVGSAAVIAGTLLGVVTLVDAGGVLLVVALALLMLGVRGSGGRGRWRLHLYRVLVAIVLVGVPVGLLLARV